MAVFSLGRDLRLGSTLLISKVRAGVACTSSEAPRASARGICNKAKRNCAEANPASLFGLRRGRLSPSPSGRSPELAEGAKADPPRASARGILAKASELFSDKMKPMYELKIVSNLAAAHQLRDFEGQCENLHGHNWKIEVYVTGDDLQENGILIDFKLIKKATERVIQGLDHKFLNELEGFREINPSSENIARYIYESLSRDLNNDRVRVSRVTAWESDSACAAYTGS